MAMASRELVECMEGTKQRYVHDERASEPVQQEVPDVTLTRPSGRIEHHGEPLQCGRRRQPTWMEYERAYGGDRMSRMRVRMSEANVMGGAEAALPPGALAAEHDDDGG